MQPEETQAEPQEATEPSVEETAQPDTTTPEAPQEAVQAEPEQLTRTTPSPTPAEVMLAKAHLDAARILYLGEAANIVQQLQNDAAALGLVVTDLTTLGSLKSGEVALFLH